MCNVRLLSRSLGVVFVVTVASVCFELLTLSDSFTAPAAVEFVTFSDPSQNCLEVKFQLFRVDDNVSDIFGAVRVLFRALLVPFIACPVRWTMGGLLGIHTFFGGRLMSVATLAEAIERAFLDDNKLNAEGSVVTVYSVPYHWSLSHLSTSEPRC